MHNDNTWELPFSQPAELELQSEWGTLALVPVEPDQMPRLELTQGSAEHIAVHVEKVGDTVRVALDPQRTHREPDQQRRVSREDADLTVDAAPQGKCWSIPGVLEVSDCSLFVETDGDAFSN